MNQPESQVFVQHPTQPLVTDAHGVQRFKENKIVSFLAEGRLNELCAMDFSDEDREQLAQLIGYSLSGFGELSYVSDETFRRAQEQSELVAEIEPSTTVKEKQMNTETDTPISVLRSRMEIMTSQARMDILERLFDGYCTHCGDKHPDDGKCQCWNDA